MYLSVVISAFLAATIFPAQSEAILAYHLSSNPAAAITLVTLATAGNLLGAGVNWGLGRFLTHHRDKSWFPIRAHRLETAEQHYRRYGRFSLLLSWVPFIGDPITLVAGMLREPLWSFVLLVTVAKCARYIVVAMAVLNSI